jgi:hypothetical protein
MKIEVPTNTNTIKFVHLVYGGLFNYEGKYMMKITNLDGNLEYNSIRLHDGVVFTTNADTLVTPVNAKLVIE